MNIDEFIVIEIDYAKQNQHKRTNEVVHPSHIQSVIKFMYFYYGAKGRI